MRPLILLLLALAVAGCASLGSSVPGEEKVYIGDISNLPQVKLPGATMQDARSVAMAAARTKGWDIIAADANRLTLERPLPPGSPQAQALGSVLAPPRIQVQTDIVERGDGTIVALQAFVLTNPGTPEEKRINYTSDYESQLLISLSSLTSAWLAARDKLRSEVPVLAATETDADADTTAGTDLGDVAATVGAGGGDAAAAEVARAEDDPASQASQAAPEPAQRAASPTRQQPVPQQTTVPQQPSARQTAASAPAAPPAAAGSALVAPTIDDPGSPSTAAEAAAPSAQPPAAAANPGAGPAAVTPASGSGGSRNDMLVLNQGSRKGLWAYYAEDFARLRGCALGDRGAVLLQETDGFEVHEVQCVGSSNQLVKCRGGVCEPLR
ncbi:hypothetical protein CKO31_10970 [Thiohalocapsa halophila]|uniref:Penicillin-binding protein activator LpoB n=2 Tax=Thiohalocapsa halophila TaxID=69359 RepID=A0ABS1CH53_9GAMM|nr:hypothetical protein [Thiohalocapsa halophila]